MLPQPKQSSHATEADSELEWLLCLAAALQAPQQQTAQFSAERRSPPRPAFLRGLQALFKGRRRVGHNRAA